MDRGAWQATVHGVTKNWTQLHQFVIDKLQIRKNISHCMHDCMHFPFCK